ncbi:MAG TPA: MBL fold metallo-hydrolase [Bacteroidia bacterium]|nr:MBL fold metallo-hydrolase [Bacteroidia bacterium]
MIDLKVFGRKPKNEKRINYSTSPNFKDGIFVNIEPTSLNPNNVSMIKLLKDFNDRPKLVKPDRELPFVKTDLLNMNVDKLSVVWFGHSSYLIRSQGLTILVDPVLNGNASPVNFFGKAFAGADYYNAEHLPNIDLLIITHDHFDHLDYKTISKIHPRVKNIVTPLGVGSHLEYWNVDRNKITELDWWNGCHLDSGIEITATPARHFSGRTIKRATSLWASFVLRLHGHKIFIGGDSGYDEQFKIIGNKFNNFDIAFLECGQYGVNWPLIHMSPEETVRAAMDLKADILFPVHWGKFVLSTHVWNEPIERLSVQAGIEKQNFVSPMIGEVYEVGSEQYAKNWWRLN